MQLARFLVASYPMGPDMLSLMTCLAKQGNEPTTEELLNAARPGMASGSNLNLNAPLCEAGDWRQALVRPLREVHGKPA